MMIDLEDTASLEKLGNALLNIPSFVVSMAKRAMEIQESRDTILNTVFNSDKFVQNVDFALLDSSTKLLPRLKDIEIVTGLNALYLEDEEHEPTIPEQITELKERIEKGNILPIEPEDDNRETFDPTSKVQKSAVEFLKFACGRPVIDGSKSVTNSVLKHFRKHILPEELRPKETASREWKSELKEVITQLAPCVKIDKKGNGDNRGIRFVFPRNFDTSMTKRKLPVSY